MTKILPSLAFAAVFSVLAGCSGPPMEYELVDGRKFHCHSVQQTKAVINCETETGIVQFTAGEVVRFSYVND